MDTTPLGLILTQGPLGIVAGLFIWLYVRELSLSRNTTKEHAEDIAALNTTLQTERDRQYAQLDEVRLAQIAREQEVARTLKEYGKSVLTALDQITSIANNKANRGIRGKDQ